MVVHLLDLRLEVRRFWIADFVRRRGRLLVVEAFIAGRRLIRPHFPERRWGASERIAGGKGGSRQLSFGRLGVRVQLLNVRIACLSARSLQNAARLPAVITSQSPVGLCDSGI